MPVSLHRHPVVGGSGRVFRSRRFRSGTKGPPRFGQHLSYNDPSDPQGLAMTPRDPDTLPRSRGPVPHGKGTRVSSETWPTSRPLGPAILMRFPAGRTTPGRRTDAPSFRLLLITRPEEEERPFDHVRPKPFMYTLDFRNPIRDAFFLTASVGRPSWDATSAVGRFGNSLRSSFTSSLVHDPLILFLAIA